MCTRSMCFSRFWLRNVLRATAACHVWTSERQKLFRPCGVLCILTGKSASRHSSVPFFICLLNSYLRTRRFSEATFRTSRTTNHGKNTAIRDVPNISRTCTFLLHVYLLSADSSCALILFLVVLHACWSSFCWLDISTLLLNPADLASLLCFSTLHIVGR